MKLTYIAIILIVILLILGGCAPIKKAISFFDDTTTTTTTVITTTSNIVTTTLVPNTATTTTIPESFVVFPKHKIEVDEVENFIKFLDNSQYVLSYIPGNVDWLYLTNNARKKWGVQILQNELKDYQDLIDYTSITKWNVWENYFDDSKMNKLHEKGSQDLSEMVYYIEQNDDQFVKYNYSLDDYNDDSSSIERDIFREWVLTKYGYIPLYKVIYSEINDFGYWQDSYDKPLYVYIIPCTEKMLIYYFPTHSDISFSPSSKTKDASLELWNNQLLSKRGNDLKKVESVMEFCGITSIDITAGEISSRKISKKFILNWKYYYQVLLNTSFIVTPTIAYNDGFYLTGYDYSFIVNEDGIFTKSDKQDVRLKFQVFNDEGNNFFHSNIDQQMAKASYLIGNKEYSGFNRNLYNNMTSNQLYFVPYIVHWRQVGTEYEEDIHYLGNTLVFDVSQYKG